MHTMLRGSKSASFYKTSAIAEHELEEHVRPFQGGGQNGSHTLSWEAADSDSANALRHSLEE